MEDLNAKVIKGINESRARAKHISCECRCEFAGGKVTRYKNRTIISVNVRVKN